MAESAFRLFYNYNIPKNNWKHFQKLKMQEKNYCSKDIIPTMGMLTHFPQEPSQLYPRGWRVVCQGEGISWSKPHHGRDLQGPSCRAQRTPSAMKGAPREVPPTFPCPHPARKL